MLFSFFLTYSIKTLFLVSVAFVLSKADCCDETQNLLKVFVLGGTINSNVDPERLPEQSYLNHFLFYSSFYKACETCSIARYVSTKHWWFLMYPNDFAVENLVEVFLAVLVYPIYTLWPFFSEGHHAFFKCFPQFSLNYTSLDVIFSIKSGCCDENSAFESHYAWRCIGSYVNSERLPEQPHLPCYSLSIILSFILLLTILPLSLIYDMVVAHWSMQCSFSPLCNVLGAFVVSSVWR